MSDILFQEFETDLDRDIFCYEKELDLALRQNETIYELSVFCEADNSNESSGIFGFFKNAWKRISEFYQKCFNAILKFLTGKTPTKDTRDEKFEINPKTVVQYADKYIDEDIKIAGKIMTGKATKGEVEDLCEKHQDSFRKIGGYVGGLSSLVIPLLLDGTAFKKWQKQTEEVAFNNQEVITNFAKDYNHSNSKSEKDAIKKEALNLVLADMQKCGQYGNHAILDFCKRYYVSKAVNKEIDMAADAMTSKKGRQRYKEVLKGRRTEQEKTEKAYKALSKNEKLGENMMKKETRQDSKHKNPYVKAKDSALSYLSGGKYKSQEELEHAKNIQKIARSDTSQMKVDDDEFNKKYKYDSRGNRQIRKGYKPEKLSNYERIQRINKRASEID